MIEEYTMFWNKLTTGLMGCLFVMLAFKPVYAEDIDLFANPTATTDIPNVLIVVDNTANWSTAFAAEMNALSTTLASLQVGKFRVGIMMYTETGSGNGGNDGGYVRAAVRTLDATKQPLYQSLVNSFSSNGDKSNNGKLGLSMAEVNAYFTGSAAFAGATKAKRDYTGNASGTAQSNAIYALAGNALASSVATTYSSPVTSSCQKNFVIFLSNGKSNANTNDNTQASTLLSSAGGNTTAISLIPNGYQTDIADEWSRYMASKATAPIITYVIDVVPSQNGQYSTDYQALLKSMATQGKGKYFNAGAANAANVGTNIADALNTIFTEIQAVNSVFASATLPLSVNAQGTYLNQVFIGMFRPDGNSAPRWYGNLKQFQIKASVLGSGFGLDLVDANSNLAINNNTGFITQCARSFWTPTTLDTYWSFAPQGMCSTANSASSNTPDGDIVEKGAAAYKLRSLTPANRVVKTCDATTCNALTSFDTTNIACSSISVQAGFGVASTAACQTLVNWARGTDSNDENGNSNVAEMRPSVHGDVVHSRPVAVDYGSGNVVVYYGADDGMLHAIVGNQTSAYSGTSAGGELWSFVAPEQYGRLKRLYDNSPAIPVPSTGSNSKPYFFDGPVSAYQSGSTVWIYASQRRGGRMIYAFDVSSPASPSFKWRIGCTTPLGNNSGCITGFTGMGQTWSTPVNFKAAGYPVPSASVNTPLLIVGGGYDTCEDADNGTTNNTCSSPSGNKIYVLDANSGALLQTFTTLRSVVGDITIVHNASTGLADYAYATDTGGNVYRITIGNVTPATSGGWTMTQIASLGCATTASCNPNRKFLFGPEVVVTSNFNAVLMGSGDREHPLLTNLATASVANDFFMIEDKPTDNTWLSNESGNCQGQSLICLASLEPGSSTSTTGIPVNQTNLQTKKGWYLTLGSHEQVVTSAIVVYGVTTFGTHTPVVAATCGGLGDARFYNVNYLDASAPSGGTSLYAYQQGGGLPISPTSGLVTVVNPTTGQNMTVPFVTGTGGGNTGGNGCVGTLCVTDPNVNGSSNGNKERVYWYIQQ
jgi:type IV pilus assembly protein PilY1